MCSSTLVQGLHQRVAVFQHSALVDRAFVGHLAFVDGGWLSEQQHARDAVGAAGGVGRELVQHGLEMRQYFWVRQHLGQRRIGGQASPIPQLGRGEQHGAHFFQIQTGDDRVLHIRRTGGNDLGA